MKSCLQEFKAVKKPLVSVLIAFSAMLGGSSAFAASSDDVLKPYRGAVTYVDFWASWCAPCAESFPWLNAMQAKYAQRGLKVVGVNLDTEAASAERFLKRYPAQFSIYKDPAGQLAEQYGVEGMPYAVILDANGKIVHRHTGYRAGDAGEYEKAIQDALAHQEKTK